MLTFRVDKNNALGIKPVSVRVELFVVLQNGKKIGLSLGRWTQTRGAASGFASLGRAGEWHRPTLPSDFQPLRLAVRCFGAQLA